MASDSDDVVASDGYGEPADEGSGRIAESQKPLSKGERGSRVQHFTAVAALVIGVLSLGLSTWATARTLEYSSLTSEPHVKAYLVGIHPAARVDPPDPGLVYCEADIRLANTGGAGAILESIDVTARVGTSSGTQYVDAVREFTDAVEDSYVGSTLFTSYALNRTFPLLVPPYDVAEITELTAELESKTLQFSHTRGPYAVGDASAIEVSVSFRLHFADGAELSIPEERCTSAVPSG